jgi:hypothetical protein
MNLKIAIFGIISGLVIMFVILELVRRRALKERYAILWLVLAIILVVLSLWSSLLEKIADLLNIYYAPSILFSLSLLFIFAIMIHFSVVLSKHSKGYQKMAQRISILEEKLQQSNQEETDQRLSPEDMKKTDSRKDKILHAQRDQGEEKAGTKAP